MLQLVNITKDYKVADTVVKALKGVSITFRDNEFVSILGPSGCGKTTLLNIIGGLDHCTNGDLYIDDISTKNYKDGDWDTYRNHRIGFVFQSYNLIPHQTVLENVELALTISGMAKEERIKKAKEALDKVGLHDQYYKKPNQLSGGQCQRVAIARALVNDPEILLADEPTGALDTKTSIQIMDLIKEISKDCLVIMVTHNPEIAEQYSTRIIKLLDGLVIDDSNPYNGKKAKKTQKDVSKKSKLGLWTAFKLSARNLKSKFKRTLMVCVAGSIGIIGVATVLSVSNGVTSYIKDMQEDMLSGNPITVDEETMNFELMMSNTDMGTKKDIAKDSIEKGKVNVDFFIERLIKTNQDLNAMRIYNDLNENYVEFVHQMPDQYYSAIVNYYGINAYNNLYTDIKLDNPNGDITTRMSLSSIVTMYTSMLKQTELSSFASFIPMFTQNMNQSVGNNDFISQQYDIISNKQTSKLATEANEIMIVVNDDTQLTDILLAQLGYYSQDEFLNILYRATKDDKYNAELDKKRFTYDELLGKTFTYYPNNTVYTQTPASSPLATINPFVYNAYENNNWNEGKIELKVTAILRQKKSISYGCLQSGIYYTPEFTKKFIQDNINSSIVNTLKLTNQEQFTSTKYVTTTQHPTTGETITTSTNIGIVYNYDYYLNGVYNQEVGFVGSTNALSSMIGAMTGQSNDFYSLTKRELGGYDLPNKIAIYPKNFELKDSVTKYLNKWNSTKDLEINGIILKDDDRSDIKYTDTLSLIIDMIESMINIVTSALIAFTALSLLVSTVMIAIITYVSVIERVKEIGVIRSLGGRKKDVSRLFTAETFIIGAISGLIGVGITYLLSGLINIIVGSLGDVPAIAILPIPTAIVMVIISIALTLISGVVPARLASKKDPVEALRSE